MLIAESGRVHLHGRSYEGCGSCCVISRKKAADTGSLLTHFICLALGLLSMKQMERNCIISRVERLVSWISIDMLPGVSACFLRLCAIVSGRRGLHDT